MPIIPAIKVSFDSWLYSCPFNYVLGDVEIASFYDTANNLNKASAVYRYNGFNKRHKPTFNLSVQEYSEQRPDGTEHLVRNTGSFTITAWAYDFDQDIVENRLGIVRTIPFTFIDYNLATITLTFARDSLNRVYIQTSTEEYYFYNDKGKQLYTTLLTRAANTTTGVYEFPLASLIALLDDVKVDEHSLVYGSKINTVAFPYPYAQSFYAYIYNLELVTVATIYYTEISSEIHQTRKETKASVDPRDPQKQAGIGTDTQRINAPIPRIQRIQTLDTGQWSLTNLDNNPAAAMARYYGIPFNNSYANLANQNDTGIQQILSAADADFTEYWIKHNSGNFNDIRTLQSSVFNYLGVLASYVCKQLKIRFSYLNYVVSLLHYFESTRGLTGRLNYGVNGNYPYYTSVKNAYSQYLLNIFDLFKIEISANDTATVLLGYYNTHIEAYNKWMAGVTTVISYNIARLGTTPANKIKIWLSQVQEFKERFMWAEIDKALNDAYNSDTAFSGSIGINDPVIAIKPGDSITLNFLDESYIPMKVMGVDLALNVDRIDYSISVKKSILDV